MATFLDYNKKYDTANSDIAGYLLSLPEKERHSLMETFRSVGFVAPRNDGFFGEMADSAKQQFVSGLRGLGSTVKELGGTSSIEEYFDGVLQTNQQWGTPENLGVSGYIGRAIGGAAGSTAATLSAATVGGLLGGPKGAAIAGGATAFAQTFGDNVQRNREAGYDEQKAYGMAFLESGVNAVIENAPWGIVGKGGKLAVNAGRLRKISAAGKKELLNKIGQRMSAQIGKEQTQNLLFKLGKQAAVSGLGESGEEGLQYINSYVNQKLGGDPNAKFSINEIADAMAQGFIGGFALGGVQSVPGIRHEAQMRAGKIEPSSKTVPMQERNLLDRLVVDIGSDLGIKVDFMDNRPDRAKQEKISNGFYDKSNKTLYLNRNTYIVDPMETLGHELKHYIDDNIPELSKAFDALLEAGKNEAGKTRPSEIARLLGYSAKKGNKEFSADMFGKLFARQDTWAKTAESLESKTPGMGEKFLQTMREFLALIKARLTGTPEAETYLNNVAELEAEVGKMLAELRRRNGNSSQVENVVGAKGNTDVESVPVSQINVDAQRFQFKSNTSKISGVDESNKLGGDWNAIAAGNLYLWQDKSGKLYVVNGHHRFALAQRNGVENVNAIIDRETDGVTAEQARRNGVLINILDDQGDVRDYASFVRSENLSEQEAEDRGITARKKGRAGFLLGKAGDTLYEAYINEVIPESKAVIIAEVANGNEAVEYAGIKLATDRKLADETLRQTLKLAAQNTSGKKADTEQGGLFDMVDDSVLQEWEAIGKLATKHIDNLKKKIKSRKSAVKNPEDAREGDIEVGKNAEKLLSQAQEELARWENYATDSELMAQLREEAGIAPQEVVSETEKTTAPEEVVSAENAQTTPADEDAAGLFEAQEETVSKKESVEPVDKENLTTETAATAEESTEVKREKDEDVNVFLKRFKPQIQAIVAQNKIEARGNFLDDDLAQVARIAAAKAYEEFDPENGASLDTYASAAAKNAITDLNNKQFQDYKNTGGSISLNQTNDQGEALGEAVADENKTKEPDSISARENPEEANRRIAESEKLSPTQKKIVELFNQGLSPSLIIRKLGMRFGKEGHEYMSNEEFQQQITAIRTIADEEGIVYSRKWGQVQPYYAVPFAESVDAVMNDTYSGNGSVFMRDTPQLFVDMGFSKLPIMTTANHVKSIYSAKQTTKDHNHDLGELIKQIPEKLENPLMVITSETHPDTSVVVILELTDKNNNAVVVPVLLNGRSDQNKIDAHIVTSAYGKKNVFSKLAANAVNKENAGVPSVLYAQKNAEPILNAEGVQFPNRYAFDSVNHNITDVGLKIKPQTETLQFKNWFADSKVVDENGAPLVVYHGSSADFTVFDHRFGFRNGAAEGRGFYFTSDKNKAEGYKTDNGKLFEVYLRLQKPLDPDELTITKAEVEKIIRAIDADGTYVADYAENDIGYPGKMWYNRAVKRTVDAIYDSSDNNADIVAEVYSVFGQGDALAKITEATGYDGFIKGDVYVVFNPNQIKSATDNIGTYDLNNPDIRYSRKILHQQINPIVRDGKVRDEYADLLENKEYTPESIAKWSAQAFEWILKRGGVANAAQELLSDKAPADGHVAEIARRYILNSDVFANSLDKADRVKLYELEIDARSAWGKAGRAMQLNVLNLQDVASVQALLNKLHKDMPDADLQKLRNQIKDELDVDIFDLDDNIVKDRFKLDAVLRAHLAQKAKWYNKFYEYWINAILSGPTTHFSNFLGNTANAVYELGIKRFTEALVNVAAGRKDGATFGEFREMIKAMNWRNAAKAFVEAKNIEVLDPSGKFLENQGVAIGGKTGRAIRMPGRLLKAADAFAKALIQPMETAAYAYRMGVQKGLSGAKLQNYIQQQLTDKDSAAYAWATERAKVLTFQEDPGSAVKALMHLRESGGAMGVMLKLMLPFLKTPSNILKQGIRKSPLGAIDLAVETGKLALGKRQFDGEYIARVAEQLLAWGAVMALAGMGDDDDLPIITGSSAAYGSAEYGYKANKVPPYSIRIGDNYYSYQRIEPFSTGLAAIADGIQAFRNARNGKDATQIMKDLMTSSVRIISEKSYIDSIGEIVKLVEDPERHGMKPATNLLSSSIPALYRQISQAMTEEVGDNKSRNKGWEWWKDQFDIVTNRAGITMPVPKIDYFGREVKKDDWGDTMFSALRRLSSLKKIEADNMDQAERLIWNYNQKNPNSEYYPPLLRNTFTVNKEKLYLAGEDYHDFAVEAGKLAHRQINNAIRAGVIKVNNPTDKDIEIIKRIFSRARKETQSKFIKRAKKDK